MPFQGNTLRRRRESADLTREQVAVRTRRSAQSVMAYELGHVCPPLPVIERLAAAVGCSVADLVDGGES